MPRCDEVDGHCRYLGPQKALKANSNHHFYFKTDLTPAGDSRSMTHDVMSDRLLHLKQGTIRQLSEVCDGFPDKLIIFAPFMWLEQTYGTIYILSLCLSIVQREHTYVKKLLLLFLKLVFR